MHPTRSRIDSIASQSRRDYLYKLNYFYEIANSTILHRQDPITGLIPSLNSKCEAWVRDNVYVATALWGMSLSYLKFLDYMDNKSRCFELQQSVVKLMRALLNCMIKQTDKVEAFKVTLSPSDALHAKYSSKTTETVVGDYDYGHLQLDATSLYLLMLAQMISSGVNIIFTLDEVDFIQNLVFYIQNTHMTPDFGTWERGDKTNHGVPELNTSSVGMAKAALEALNELNLFGANGSPFAIIHVSPDFIVWCNDVLRAVLPRESTSKETDAALLPIITFPAFAVDDISIVEKTKQDILSKLEGNYGIRRFMRDGYKCPREDQSRLYYEPSELKLFENIECEWPFFWMYLIIDGVFRGNLEQVETVCEKLDKVLLQDKNGFPLVPQLYAVPGDKVEEELANPGSVDRIAGGSIPFDWGQSLYILAMLLRENLLAPGELDPLNRRLQTEPKPDTLVQVSILADSIELKKQFQEKNIKIFTVQECTPISIYPAQLLQKVMGMLGENERLGLSGNPTSELGILSTSMLYTLDKKILAFIPELFYEKNFYTYTDPEYLVDCFKSYISIVEKNWSHKTGRPTVIFYLSSTRLDIDGTVHPAFINACKRISSGLYGGIRIHYDLVEISESVNEYELTCSLVKKPSRSTSHSSSSIISISGTSKPSLLQPIDKAFNILSSTTKRAKTLSEIRNALRKSQIVFDFELPSTLTKSGVESNIELDDSVSTTHKAVDITNQSQHQIDQYSHKTVDDVIALLEVTDDISCQSDILYYLYISRGLGFEISLHGSTYKLASIIKDMYDKAVVLRSWWLIRHCSGMLSYQARSMSYALTAILIHNKQVTIGYPEAPFKEITISKPMPSEMLLLEIKQACVDDVSMIVLTQEMILSIGNMMCTDSSVFNEIICIRIGFIVRVLIQEIKRINSISFEEAHRRLNNLSPFELKIMLTSLLIGRELDTHTKRTGSTVSRRLRGTVDGKLGLKQGKWLGCKKKSIAALNIEDTKIDLDDKFGQWVRRRRIDGSLNRVPVKFYERIWVALDKCYGFTIANIHLSNNLTREMTREELKFAIEIERAINSIPIPHYRQLIVEATLMACLILQSNSKFFYHGTVDMDDVVFRACQLYKEDALQSGVTADCLRTLDTTLYYKANAIVSNFFDCAPSGRYGTMNYMLRALFHLFDLGVDFEWTMDIS
ncbi:hypothetical protein GJ496_009720 [Pomphorhynchus laevis]|nr:hypothetical protein GJ496_009720 [Pomphorhynchus laevis]